MKIRMLFNRGPSRCKGEVYDVPDAEAKTRIAMGEATAVDGTERAVAGSRETATAKRAAPKKKTTKRKAKKK